MSFLERVKSRIGGTLRTNSTLSNAGSQPQSKVEISAQARELYSRVNAVSFWFHSIDLGHGVITPGLKSPEIHASEMTSFRFPDLKGKTVLDIGAWDGFYSFTAEKLGASRVVALDGHVWALDWEAKRKYKAQCQAAGTPVQPYYLVPELWDFDALPGKRGFDLAHEVRKSRVDVVVDDFMKMNLESIGEFDVVLYLGVLYHMENPLEALRRLRQVTKEVAIIETAAIAVRGFEELSLCEFYPLEGKLAGDPTNFWAPNAAALIGLCKTAGFSKVEIMNSQKTPVAEPIERCRISAHAFV